MCQIEGSIQQKGLPARCRSSLTCPAVAGQPLRGFVRSCLRQTAVDPTAACFYRGSDIFYFSIPPLHNWTLRSFYFFRDTRDRNSARLSWARRRVAPHITGDGFDLLVFFLFSFDSQLWILCLYSRHCGGSVAKNLRSRAFANPQMGSALLLAALTSTLFTPFIRFCYSGIPSFCICIIILASLWA